MPQTINQSAPTRYRSIDGFRFFAALGIVLRHYTRYSENPFWEVLFAKSYLFVDLFFVISGFVIMLAYGNSLKTTHHFACFLQNRLARVYPLHFVMFMAFLAMDLAAEAGLYAAREVHTFHASEIASSLLLVQAWGFDTRLAYNYPSWSISAEWMLYLLFPGVVLLGRKGGATALFLAAGCCWLLLEILSQSAALPEWTMLTWHFGYLRAIPTFLVGAALYCSIDHCAWLFRSLAWPVVFFVMAVAGMLLGLNDLWIISLFILVVASATGAEHAGACGILTEPVMGTIGDWSYALYMVHAMFGVVFVATIGPRLLHLHSVALDIFIGLSIVVCTFVAALVYRYFEVPARQLFRHKGKRVRLQADGATKA